MGKINNRHPFSDSFYFTLIINMLNTEMKSINYQRAHSTVSSIT